MRVTYCAETACRAPVAECVCTTCALARDSQVFEVATERIAWEWSRSARLIRYSNGLADLCMVAARIVRSDADIASLEMLAQMADEFADMAAITDQLDRLIRGGPA